MARTKGKPQAVAKPTAKAAPKAGGKKRRAGPAEEAPLPQHPKTGLLAQLMRQGAGASRMQQGAGASPAEPLASQPVPGSPARLAEQAVPQAELVALQAVPGSQRPSEGSEQDLRV